MAYMEEKEDQMAILAEDQYIVRGFVVACFATKGGMKRTVNLHLL